MPGGRIPPDNRGPQAKGIGKNSKRHDMERQATPGLHGSDLQQGDIQKLERGQRVAPIRTQPAAAPQRRQSGGQARGQPRAPMQTPDAIEFLGGRSQGLKALDGEVTPSQGYTAWLPFVRQMVIGPGSSGMMAGAYINQFRQIMGGASVTRSTVVNLENMDDALEAGLEEGF